MLSIRGEYVDVSMRLLLVIAAAFSPNIHVVNCGNQQQQQVLPSSHRKYSQEDYVEVEIAGGRIRGRLSNIQGLPVASYFGIPYAKSPVGVHGRFAAAEGPPEPWGDVILNATQPGFDCHSLRDDAFVGFSGSEMWNANTKFSENCLNLNIWAPKHAANASVMVWIFGGGFYSGSPSLELYDGSTMAAIGDVIVVAVNYRLGPFGFLNLDEQTSNVGLLDQQMALIWVNRNIHHFGGDPNRVTLFGESAGAVSVSAHLFARTSWPLFRYAILQSGAITCPWATKTPRTARENAYKFLDAVGCSNGSDAVRIACAREANIEHLYAAYQQLSTKATFMEYQFVPRVVDSTFFRGNVLDQLVKGEFKKTAIIIGTNADEGTYWLPYFLPKYFDNRSEGLIKWREYNDSVEQAFTDTYFYPSIVRKAIEYHYLLNMFANESTTVGNRWQLQPSKSFFRNALSKVLGDYFFTCRTLDFADAMANTGSAVYTYYFNERSSANPWPSWMGVMHGYEIEYMFGVPLNKPESYTKDEVEFSWRVVQYWTSFAKNGSPAADRDHSSNIPTMWPQYEPDKRAYLILQSARTAPPASWINQRTDQDDCAFWRETSRVCKRQQDASTNSGTQLHSAIVHCTKHNKTIQQVQYMLVVCAVWYYFLRSFHA